MDYITEVTWLVDQVGWLKWFSICEKHWQLLIGSWLPILLEWGIDWESLPWEGRGRRSRASRAGGCTGIWVWRRAVHLGIRGYIGSSNWVSSSVGVYPESSCTPSSSNSLFVWLYPYSLPSPISAGRPKWGRVKWSQWPGRDWRLHLGRNRRGVWTRLQRRVLPLASQWMRDSVGLNLGWDSLDTMWMRWWYGISVRRNGRMWWLMPNGIETLSAVTIVCAIHVLKGHKVWTIKKGS